MPDFDVKVMLKNLAKSAKDYGTLMGEQNKLYYEQAANRLKLKDNWLFKLKEQAASPEGQGRQFLQQQFQQQQPGQATPFQPHVRRGKGGMLEQYQPSPEYMQYGMLKAKKQRAPQLWTEQDEERFKGLEQKIYGTSKKLTPHQEQKADIEKKKVLSVLEQGWFEDKEGGKPVKRTLSDRALAENYIVQTYDIDITDPDIQQALTQYKPAEEEIDTTSWFERVFQKQKYPRKEKYGYTFEQRPDPKTGKLMWHKVEEK